MYVEFNILNRNKTSVSKKYIIYTACFPGACLEKAWCWKFGGDLKDRDK